MANPHQTTTKSPQPPVTLPKADNYVDKIMSGQERLPPVSWKTVLQDIQWISLIAVTVPPLIWFWGMSNVALEKKTLYWSILYYFMTATGITAGYHRLWAHRSYNACLPLEIYLALVGAGAVQGSIKWWSRGHRAHHRYTDTPLDPYNAKEGFIHSHIGWVVFRPRNRIGAADVSDLTKNWIVRFQHKHYLELLLLMSFAVPTLVAGLGWGDYWGGFIYAGCARLVFAHHSTFCVNSIAHMIGDAGYDNKHTPRDSFITALVTAGEGYHNFHHQFPMDYRNAIRWFQYDPTKWLIATWGLLGLATNLTTFPNNEIRKGQYAMKLQKLANEEKTIAWAKEDLPLISWDDFQAEAKTRCLVAVHGYIHDCSTFVKQHPGGEHLIRRAIGTDATTAFYGGVYDHSNAAHNLLSMFRVGILDGGMEVESFKKTPFGGRSLVAHLGDAGLGNVPSLSTSPTSSHHSTPLTSPSASSLHLPDLPIKEEYAKAFPESHMETNGYSADQVAWATAMPPAPVYQPVANLPNPYTLGVTPSEHIRITKTVPRFRPGVQPPLAKA